MHVTSEEGATNYIPRDLDPLLVRLSCELVPLQRIEVKEEQFIAEYYRDFLLQYKKSILAKVLRKIVSALRSLGA